MRFSWNTFSSNEELLAIRGRAECAVILGSGLAAAADGAETVRRVPYARACGLRAPSVAGHPGHLSLSRVGGTNVFLFAGRFHAYEGFDADEVVSPVSLAAFLGAGRLIVTNAAGSLTRRIVPGTWMLASDAVAFPARFSLALEGAADGGGDPAAFRRPCGAPLVAPRMAGSMRAAARTAGVPFAEGILCWTLGPTFETAAEARAAALSGADAVSMSSVPELAAARNAGIEAVSLSWITNHTANVSREKTDHGAVVSAGAAGARTLLALLAAYLGAPGER